MKIGEVYKKSFDDVLRLMSDDISLCSSYVFQTPKEFYSLLLSRSDKILLGFFEVDIVTLSGIKKLKNKDMLIDKLLEVQNIKNNKFLHQTTFNVITRALSQALSLFDDPDDVIDYPELQMMLEAYTSFMDPDVLSPDEINFLAETNFGDESIKMLSAKFDDKARFAFYMWVRDNISIVADAFASIRQVRNWDKNYECRVMVKLAIVSYKF